MADVKENPVFLGIPDAEIDEQNEKTCTWDTNKLGGYADWMHNGRCDTTPCCTMCSNHLYLVTQIYCPLDNSQYHRTLYVFGCVNPACWNSPKSWLVLRSQVLAQDDNEQKHEKAPEGFSSVDDWCDDAEDWGDSEDNIDTVQDLVAKTSQLSLSQTNISEEKPPKAATSLTQSIVNQTIILEEKPLKSTTISYPSMSQCQYKNPCFTPHYINVFEDTSSQKQSRKTLLTAHEKALIEQYQQQEGVDLKIIVSGHSSTNAKSPATEGYEKTAVAHGDYGFHKFLKYLQSCPEQCVRYQWSGTPLSISNVKPTEIVLSIPSCPNCGATRVFELQLMPALVPLLKQKHQSHSNKASYTNSESSLVHNNTGCHENRKDDINSEGSLVSSNIDCHSNKINNANSEKSLDTSNMSCHSNNKSSCHNNRTNIDSCHDNIDEQIQKRETVKEKSKNLEHDENACKEDEMWKQESNTDANCVVIDENVMDMKKLQEVLAHEQDQKRIEFGTVMVFSCGQSCWDSEENSPRQEYVIIQADPDAELFQKKC